MKCNKIQMFHLKGNTDCYTWTPSRTKQLNQWQYWILAAVSRCCSWCIALNRYGRNFKCFVAHWAFLHIQTLSLSRNFVISQCIVVLYGTSLSGYSLLSASPSSALTIPVGSNVRRWIHVLLVNTCSHLHSFCAPDVSSGLATRITFIQVSWGRFGKSITRGLTFLWFYFCAVVRDCYWFAF
jgi:hypothetical protein